MATIDMTERTTSTVCCDKFEFGKGDDFAEWVEVFIRAVHNATNPQTNERKKQVLLDWLPLCLDKRIKKPAICSSLRHPTHGTT
jgi:hypothetical protein